VSFFHCQYVQIPQVKFNDYAKNIAETKQHMSTDSSNAFFSMTQAEYAAGEFKQKVAEGSMTARVRVGSGWWREKDSASKGEVYGASRYVN